LSDLLRKYVEKWQYYIAIICHWCFNIYSLIMGVLYIYNISVPPI